MDNFSTFGLKTEIVKAIDDLGFVNPMPVQAKVIPVLLSKDTDMVALAQTGTGKTAAFGLPLLQKCDMRSNAVEALVLSPTRELCMQIAKDIENFAKYIPGFRVAAVYGGASIEKQLSELSRGVKIVVATPGRMLDIIRRGKVNFSQLHTVVFDEADEMLSMGFKEELDGILASTPEQKNTWLFSATMPKEIRGMATKYMNDPEEITIGNKNEGSANVVHHYYMAHSRDRYRALKRIIDFYPNIYSIIFCRTRRETQEIAESLIKDGYNADALHGDLSQAQRDNAMSRFRLKNLQLLVATDVAARGLDVNNLTHVLNYNLPDDIEQYTHRSGRTGRADKNGISICVINTKEKGKIRDIEKQIKKNFEYKEIPSGEAICEKQLFGVIDRMEKVDLSLDAIDTYLPAIYEKLQDLSKEDLIKRFVALEFNRFLEYYQNAPEMQAIGEASKKDSRSSPGDFSRIFINIGKIDGVMPQNVIGLINDYVKTRDLKIGHIDILKTFTFVEVELAAAEKVVEALQHAIYKDRKVFAEISKDQRKSSSRGRGDGGDRPRRSGDGGGRSSDSRGGYRKREDNRGSGDVRRSDRGGDSRGYRKSESDERGGYRRADDGGRGSYRKSEEGSRGAYRKSESSARPDRKKSESKSEPKENYGDVTSFFENQGNSWAKSERKKTPKK